MDWALLKYSVGVAGYGTIGVLTFAWLLSLVYCWVHPDVPHREDFAAALPLGLFFAASTLLVLGF